MRPSNAGFARSMLISSSVLAVAGLGGGVIGSGLLHDIGAFAVKCRNVLCLLTSGVVVVLSFIRAFRPGFGCREASRADAWSCHSFVLFVLASAAERQAVPTRGLIIHSCFSSWLRLPRGKPCRRVVLSFIRAFRPGFGCREASRADAWSCHSFVLFVLASAAERQAVPTRGLVIHSCFSSWLRLPRGKPCRRLVCHRGFAALVE
jgi:hypothetical protein